MKLSDSYRTQVGEKLPRILQPGKLGLLKCFVDKSVKDLLLQPQSIFDQQEHLQSAIEWLKLAHDLSPNDGVSWGYSLKGSWRDSYRETSGYIADTFFDIAKYNQDEDAFRRAIAISKWLVAVQNEDGSISNPRYTKGGIVFDTGQVLQGLIRAYEETQDKQFLDAAIAAGDWLVKVADDTGKWTKNTHYGIPHVYNTRVAWPLLKLNSISPHPERERVARANLDWAISQQKNGWFEQNAFRSGEAPFTHNIAYAIRGLLEAGDLLNEDKYINAAISGAIALIPHVESDGFIPGQFDANGKPENSYCCLTGNCQLAIIWLKLFGQTKEEKYYQSANLALRYVMSCQDIKTEDFNIRGGIKGSQPIWGTYTRLSYPNWATKFFIDGLILLMRTKP